MKRTPEGASEDTASALPVAPGDSNPHRPDNASPAGSRVLSRFCCTRLDVGSTLKSRQLGTNYLASKPLNDKQHTPVMQQYCTEVVASG